MFKEEFDEIRRAPVGRSEVFSLETSIVRRRKQNNETVKSKSRILSNIFDEAIRKIFDDDSASARGSSMNLKDKISKIPHYEDLDNYFLILGAWLHNEFPEGLNLTGTSKARLLDPTDLNTQNINDKLKIIRNLNELSEKVSLDMMRVDLLAYYMMFLQN